MATGSDPSLPLSRAPLSFSFSPPPRVRPELLWGRGRAAGPEGPRGVLRVWGHRFNPRAGSWLRGAGLAYQLLLGRADLCFGVGRAVKCCNQTTPPHPWRIAECRALHPPGVSRGRVTRESPETCFPPWTRNHLPSNYLHPLHTDNHRVTGAWTCPLTGAEDCLLKRPPSWEGACPAEVLLGKWRETWFWCRSRGCSNSREP